MMNIIYLCMQAISNNNFKTTNNNWQFNPEMIHVLISIVCTIVVLVTQIIIVKKKKVRLKRIIQFFSLFRLKCSLSHCIVGCRNIFFALKRSINFRISQAVWKCVRLTRNRHRRRRFVHWDQSVIVNRCCQFLKSIYYERKMFGS